MWPTHLGRHWGVFLACSLVLLGLIPSLLPSTGIAPVPPVAVAPVPSQHLPQDSGVLSASISAPGTLCLSLHLESPSALPLSPAMPPFCQLTFISAEAPTLTASSQIAVLTPYAAPVTSATPSPVLPFSEPLSAGLILFGIAGLLLRNHLRRPAFRRV